MRVLFISSWFPNRTGPVDGDFVERHALAVSKLYPTFVLHVAKDDSMAGHGLEFTRVQKHQLTEMLGYYRGSCCRFRFAARCINFIKLVMGYIKGYLILRRTFGKPHIIHANIIFPSSLVACIISVIAGVPFVVSEHWTRYLSRRRKDIPMPYFTRIAIRRAYTVMPVSENLAASLQWHGYKGRYHVVPNVVDTRVFYPGNDIKMSGPCRFLHVSSMNEEQKNISGILRVVKELSVQRDDFTFNFVGPASASQKLLSEHLDIPRHILTISGEIPHEQVAVVMQQSDVLVMFSRAENLPCVILEALASGMPVISSHTGGIGEWIHKEQGLLVAVEDEKALLKAMDYMCDHHDSFEKLTLHQYAQEHFSCEVIAREFGRIYQLALKT
jgi:glycosyltransferase involved in cell wall biosynthesis